MNMTKSEIVKSYIGAKSPAQQAQILAELNATDKIAIKDILMSAGYMKTFLAGRDMKLEESLINTMVANGAGITEIAKKYHTTTQHMREIMKDLGLKLPDAKPKSIPKIPKLQKGVEITPKMPTKSEVNVEVVVEDLRPMLEKLKPSNSLTDTELHQQLITQLHDTFIAKNNDYGNSFSKSYDKYGIVAAMVRMEDKWNRLESLTSGKKQMVNDESIADTLLDLANYCIMTVMEMKKRKDD